jgi:hypothetical protein
MVDGAGAEERVCVGNHAQEREGEEMHVWG